VRAVEHDAVLRAIGHDELRARRYEAPFGEPGSVHEAAHRDFVVGTDEHHDPDCECEECDRIWTEFTFEPVRGGAIDKIDQERYEAAEMTDDDRGWAPIPAREPNPEPSSPDELIQEMLSHQEAILADDRAACKACGKPLPPNGNHRGRPRRYHPECKEAAMKRQQRGSPIRTEPEEKPPYVVPGYKGYRRPHRDAAAAEFRRSY